MKDKQSRNRMGGQTENHRTEAGTLFGWSTHVIVFVALFVGFDDGNASAEIFGGIDFPDGASSFADNVLTYDCSFQSASGGQCPSPAFQDTSRALGPPDGAGLSLGTGGLVELLFIGNVLTNSGDATDDLHIFEVGADVERTKVAVRPTPGTAALLGASFDANSDGFYEVGNVSGGTSSIDIDSFFIGFSSGELEFNAVQLIDDEFELGTTQGTHGADIDAVGAISSAVPEPASHFRSGLCDGGCLIAIDTELPVVVNSALARARTSPARFLSMAVVLISR